MTIQHPIGPTLDRLVKITMGGDLAVVTSSAPGPTPPPPPPPPPSPDFVGSPTSGYNPLVVNFTDTTTNGPGTAWDWAFGDGGTSALQNPTHSYTAIGTYTVEMTVTVGSTDYPVIKTNYITVNPPVPNFSGTPRTGTAPYDVAFTDLTVGGTPSAWAWAFGDGGTDTVQNPTYSYTTPGTYSVELTVTIGGIDYPVTKTNYITVSPPAGPSSTLLLHFDSNFLDSSANAITVSTSANSATTTTDPKFGVASMFNDGANPCWVAVSDALVNLLTNDFTIDCWFNSDNSGGQEFIFDSRNGGSQYQGLCIYVNGGNIFWYDGGHGYGGAAYTLNVWNHVELCRSAGTCYFFLNGNLIVTTPGLSGSFDSPQYVIGAAQFTPPGVNKFSGRIDEFHIDNGNALHTASFTPPTGPYTS